MRDPRAAQTRLAGFLAGYRQGPFWVLENCPGDV